MVSQVFEGVGNVIFYRPVGNIELPGNFLVGQMLKTTQGKNLAAFVGKINVTEIELDDFLEGCLNERKL